MTEGKIRDLLNRLSIVKRELTDEKLIDHISEVEKHLFTWLKAYEIHDGKGEGE